MSVSLKTVTTTLTALILAVVPGCGGSDDAADGGGAPVNASGQNSSSAKAKAKSNTLSKVKFKDGNAKTAYSLKFREDGAKLVDGEEKEVARYTVSGRKIKIKDGDDNVLGYIVGDGKKFKVEDAGQQITFFKLQPQDDGDWKLEDRKGQLVYRIKKRDYGYEIETPDDKRYRKLKSDKGKISLRNAKEETIYSTRGDIKALAVTCVGCDAIQDIRIRFGLAVALQRAADW